MINILDNEDNEMLPPTEDSKIPIMVSMEISTYFKPDYRPISLESAIAVSKLKGMNYED